MRSKSTNDIFLYGDAETLVYNSHIKVVGTHIHPMGDGGLRDLEDLRDAIDLYISKTNEAELNELDRLPDPALDPTDHY